MGQERKLFRSILVTFKNSKLSMPDLGTPAATINAAEIPAWRKALTHTENKAADGTLPPLPERPEHHSPRAVP